MAIKDLDTIRKHFFICNGGSCKLLGAEEMTAHLRKVIKEMGKEAEIHTTKTLCNGRCKDGPVLISMPDGIWFRNILAAEVREFLRQFLQRDNAPKEKILFKYNQKLPKG